jgi:hypothetical protein
MICIITLQQLFLKFSIISLYFFTSMRFPLFLLISTVKSGCLFYLDSYLIYLKFLTDLLVLLSLKECWYRVLRSWVSLSLKSVIDRFEVSSLTLASITLFWISVYLHIFLEAPYTIFPYLWELLLNLIWCP